jgi:hypothetical protein
MFGFTVLTRKYSKKGWPKVWNTLEKTTENNKKSTTFRENSLKMASQGFDDCIVAVCCILKIFVLRYGGKFKIYIKKLSLCHHFVKIAQIPFLNM